MRRWLVHVRPGDWLAVAAAAAAVAASLPLGWQAGRAELAVVKRDGAVVAELPLDKPRRLEVQGAIGPTVIEVQGGRARVASDPGAHQYCVRQGWLARPNAIAICAPSHVSLQLKSRQGGYDSLNY